MDGLRARISMKSPARLRLALWLCLPVLSACAVTPRAQLEVLRPGQAHAKSLAVVSDFHREHEAIEAKLAADLAAEFRKRGFRVESSADKAQLVVVPTLGRMREVTAETSATPATETVRRGGARSLLGASTGGGTSLPLRNSVPTATGAGTDGGQQAGLLLTAVPAAEFRRYGLANQEVAPAWRVYADQGVSSLSWDSTVLPLVRSAVAATAPLLESGDAAMPR